MPVKDINVIIERIENLKQVIEKGFDGVHALFRKFAKAISCYIFPIVPRFMTLKGLRSFSFALFCFIISSVAFCTQHPVITSLMRVSKSLFQRPFKFIRETFAGRVITFIGVSIMLIKPVVNSFISYIISFPHRVVTSTKQALLTYIFAFLRAKFSCMLSALKNLELFSTDFAFFINHNQIITHS